MPSVATAAIGLTLKLKRKKGDLPGPAKPCRAKVKVMEKRDSKHEGNIIGSYKPECNDTTQHTHPSPPAGIRQVRHCCQMYVT